MAHFGVRDPISAGEGGPPGGSIFGNLGVPGPKNGSARHGAKNPKKAHFRETQGVHRAPAPKPENSPFLTIFDHFWGLDPVSGREPKFELFSAFLSFFRTQFVESMRQCLSLCDEVGREVA